MRQNNFKTVTENPEKYNDDDDDDDGGSRWSVQESVQNRTDGKSQIT